MKERLVSTWGWFDLALVACGVDVRSVSVMMKMWTENVLELLLGGGQYS